MTDKASKESLLEVGDHSLIMSPLGLMDLDLAEEAALKQWKKRKIQTYTDNAEQLKKVMSNEEILEKIDRVSDMTADDLPKKPMIIPDYGENGKINMVDDGTGRKVPGTRQIMIDYPGWWLSETIAGKVFGIWLSLKTKNPQITLETCDDMFKSEIEESGYKDDLLELYANKVGEISAPTVGQEKNA